MKKLFPLLCTLYIASTPFSAFAQTDEVEQTPESEPTEGEVTKETGYLEKVIELTLEDVIKRGTENSKNLSLLQINLDISRNDAIRTNYEIKKAERKIKNYESEIDDLKDRDRSSTFEERKELRETIEGLEDEIKSLEKAIKQYEAGELKIQYQEEEAKEGVKMMLTSTYSNLLLLKEQMDFTEKSINMAMQEVKKHQILYNLGRITQNELSIVQNSLLDAQKQLEDQKKQYHYTLADLCIDIGISYKPDIVVKPIEIEPAKFEMQADNNSLIEKSFSLKRAQNDLDSAYLEREEIYKEYEKGKETVYEKNNQDYLVKLAELNLEMTKNNLRNTIEELYRNAEKSYSTYENVVLQLELKEKEMEAMQIRYNLGRVSQHDFKQAQLELASAELSVYQAKVQNFTIQQSIEALHKGYI